MEKKLEELKLSSKSVQLISSTQQALLKGGSDIVIEDMIIE